MICGWCGEGASQQGQRAKRGEREEKRTTAAACETLSPSWTSTGDEMLSLSMCLLLALPRRSLEQSCLSEVATILSEEGAMW